MPGIQELLVIGVVALLVFGPDRLPELARNAGKLIGRLRAETSRNMDELTRMSEVQELRRELGQLRRELDGAAGEVRRSAGRALSDPAAGRSSEPPGRSSAASDTASSAAGDPARPRLHARANAVPPRPDDAPAPFDPDTT